MINQVNEKIMRPQTVKLICRLVAPLLDSGVVTSAEFDILKRNLSSLAKNGELAPAIQPRLITPQEAADLLAISYSQFRELEKERQFPFKRRKLGSKTVRYYLPDIINYISLGGIEERSIATEQTN